ncbi:MAG TPA: HAD hydrolase family protein [Candidatus Sabulitectum sp.]|nr:HAD hydrolase family protein [Candidatus Sabulitectum sp.]HPF31625.1 HAD hydrolase family protein [Candidatus Sabulitectum sp.]HPJ28151.1 HAD hydrolase family protein [Candidatus Sabulitectum sp.]HPR21817.1 HAD hydrolase family protein [Candidatus Sabulitectum sp.]
MTSLERIKLVALDVDGTLTDGGMLYGEQGVMQRFDSKDGQGIMRLQEKGVPVAFVSFRDFPGTRRRAADLGVELLCLGSRDKAASVRALAELQGISTDEVLFMGDDEKDLPAMLAAGLAACPGDASSAVREFCPIAAASPGGRGAVREVIDMILEARGE